jgi:FdrA protein
MMGPDCGSAILNGVPLAFANAVPKGGIGIVSASGTGLQEISCGIANRGMGITQAFGTGGRDGKEAIGGIMLKACLRYLIDDPATEVIVLIGKTPHSSVQKELWELIGATSKPVIVNFLEHIEHPHIGNLHYAVSLDTCAHLACLHYARLKGLPLHEVPEPQPPLPSHKHGKRRWLRGLYSGGTLCAEARLLYKHELSAEPYSNVTSRTDRQLSDPWKSIEDSLIDLGSDEYTVGRPHPMIDLSLRLKRLEAEAADPEVAVILMDVVLGWGAHPDPAAELAPVIAAIEKDILVVCSVLGTDGDPQDRGASTKQLRDAGALVFSSHHAAAEYAVKALKAIRGEQ